MSRRSAPSLLDRRAAAPLNLAVAWLIAAGTAVRLVMAAAIGLGIDEGYMVAAGRTLRLGYFDHPPLSWWLAAGMARLAGSEADVVVRLPFILLFAVSTWLMYRLGAALFGARAGVWAALAFNLSPVFGVTTGGWVLPDGPLTCALLAAALCLLHALQDGGWRWWLAAGAAAGLALLSKYTAGLTLAGALLYLATQPAHRRWLRRPQPYAAALLAVALFAPVVVWNATHGWASFAFQGARAAERGLHPFGPLVVLAGEALFVLPWIWLPMMAAAVAALRAGPADWRRWLLLCLGAPPILLFALVGLHARHVLFHWAAPGYLMLFPLLGAALDAAPPALVRRVAAGTAGLLLFGLAIVVSEVRWGWLPLPGDPAAQALDWTALRPALAARGLLDRPGTVIGTTGWQLAGKVGYALGPGATVICLCQDARQFGLVAPPATFRGRDVLIVARRSVSAAALAAAGVRFAGIEPLAPVPLVAQPRPAGQALLFLGHDLSVAAK